MEEYQNPGAVYVSAFRFVARGRVIKIIYNSHNVQH